MLSLTIIKLRKYDKKSCFGYFYDDDSQGVGLLNKLAWNLLCLLFCPHFVSVDTSDLQKLILKSIINKNISCNIKLRQENSKELFWNLYPKTNFYWF